MKLQQGLSDDGGDGADDEDGGGGAEGPIRGEKPSWEAAAVDRAIKEEEGGDAMDVDDDGATRLVSGAGRERGAVVGVVATLKLHSSKTGVGVPVHT